MLEVITLHHSNDANIRAKDSLRDLELILQVPYTYV